MDGVGHPNGEDALMIKPENWMEPPWDNLLTQAETLVELLRYRLLWGGGQSSKTITNPAWREKLRIAMENIAGYLESEDDDWREKG
jgi:hypothetical protein